MQAIRDFIVVSKVALLALALLAAPPVLAAPTFTVNSVLDEIDDDTTDGVCHTAANTCTLRAAIMQANTITGAGVTIFVPSGTYTLTRPSAGSDGDDSGDLNLTKPVSGNPVISIVGAGADSTIIDADQLDRVFSIANGRSASISGVTIRNGFLTHSGSGGGIYSNGVLNVRDSTIEANITDGYGGGIYSEATLTMRNSTISSNHAVVWGGGIFNAGNMIVTNSTISQNNASDSGGGIFNYRGFADIYNTSIVFNGADDDRDGNGSAGGVFNYDLNSATFNLHNTLVAGNNVANTPIYDDCTGTLNSYGRNLFWMVVGCTINTPAGGNWTDLNSLDNIGPLQDNGGPTFTHAILPGNNGIDWGDPVQGCVDEQGIPLATDQRGAARVIGVSCDIGAYEYGATFPSPTPTVPPTATATPIDTSSPTATATTASTLTGTATVTPTSTATATATAVPAATSTATAIPSATFAPSPTLTPTLMPRCPGDCNGDRQVTIDELLTMVNIVLGDAEVSTCFAGDTNNDKRITIDEILTAVNNALTDCPTAS